MPLYLCRWPNGDVSIVMARNRNDASIQLDEFENADYAEISPLSEFLIDFRLDDEGRLELAELGEGTEDAIMGTAFPELEETLTSDELLALTPESPEYQKKLREAVQRERERLWGAQRHKKVRRPRTELGKRLQKSMAASTTLVDRWVEEMAGNILDETEDEGPPN